MPNYRRYYVKGGTYFFTVVTFQRIPIFKDEGNISLLKECFQDITIDLPFNVDAMVILPDHLHAIWTLPDNDDDYSLRWKRIKASFSSRYKQYAPSHLSESLINKHEKGIWQRRFWEHFIRDQEDFNIHCNYIRYNPVKHGLVKCPSEWKQSTFKRFIEMGIYNSSWGESPDKKLIRMNLE